MGKPTGFLDYERVEATAVSPKERIKNFNEFHTPLSEAEQRCQSARCMDCGCLLYTSPSPRDCS